MYDMRFHRLVRVALGVAAVSVIAVCILLFFKGSRLALSDDEEENQTVWMTSETEADVTESASGSIITGTAPVSHAGVTGRYCLIGDSRTKGLNQVCGLSQTEHFAVVAEVAMGYSWMMNTAVWEAQATGLNDYVLLLGINDLENIDAYLEAYRGFLAQGKRVILATVGPVEEGRGGYTITNDEIDAFNERLYEVEGARVIDLNFFLWKQGFSTTDGIHYTDETYRIMETFLLTELE